MAHGAAKVLALYEVETGGVTVDNTAFLVFFPQVCELIFIRIHDYIPWSIQHHDLDHNTSLCSYLFLVQILIENRTATGVEFKREGAIHRVSATREVIVSAGAYNSPHLLLLSGIGPAEHLKEHKVSFRYVWKGVHSIFLPRRCATT